MNFVGEQGPFHDAIIGHSDYSGWIYEQIDPQMWCGHCGERMDFEQDVGWLCWACHNPVPVEWEQQHWDALILDIGLLYLTSPVARNV